MSASASWDWETKEKLLANLNDLKKKFIDIRELTPSEDGEKIAAIVKNQDKKFTTCVNGEIWEETFDRVYSLTFNQDNQLISLVFKDMEWTVAVDHGRKNLIMYGILR
jgi:hypothetical protein